jgi:nucleotide-binding universal stress UspA family protein
MDMKKLRILVPTDLSETSNLAFQSAKDMANETGATITPMYAYSKTRYDGADAFSNAEIDLKKVASQFLTDKQIEKFIVSNQNPVDAIIDNGKDYDLILMSSHGKHGFNRLLLGSVTEKVVRLSHTPVLIVKGKYPLFPMKKILLTTDFSENAYKSFPIVASLARKTDAMVHALYAIVYSATEPATHLEAFVRTKEKQFREDTKTYFSDMTDQISFEADLTKKSAHEYLTEYLENHRYNLVIMSTLGHTGLDYLRMGSTTANVLRHATTNILVTNPNSKSDWK